MKAIKVSLIGALFGALSLISGLPLSGLVVGFAASYGPAAGMLTGALSGALFSMLPMGSRFVSPLIFTFLGGLFGAIKPRGLTLFLACFAIITADLLSQVISCALSTPAGFIDPAMRALPMLGISALIVGILTPVFGLVAREERYA